jgi:hypothetical protein
MREEGSKKFYFIDMNTNIVSLRRLVTHISEFIEEYYFKKDHLLRCY